MFCREAVACAQKGVVGIGHAEEPPLFAGEFLMAHLCVFCLSIAGESGLALAGPVRKDERRIRPGGRAGTERGAAA
jgi:hypothetical protein